MLVMRAILFPDHESLILHIAVLKVSLTKAMVLALSGGLLRQALFLVLKFFTLGDLSLKNGSGLLKFHLGVAEADSVKALLDKTLSLDTFDVGDKGCLPSEELVFT